MEHEGDGDTSCNWCTRNNLLGLGKGLEDLEIRGQVETIQTAALLRQNTKKSPRDLRWRAVTQTPVKNYQLPLVWKTLLGIIIIMIIICHLVDFAIPGEHRVKIKESKEINKYPDLTRELIKLLNMRGTIILIVVGALETTQKNLKIFLKSEEKWRPSIVLHMRRLAITQTPVNDIELMPIWKTRNNNNNNNLAQ